MKATDYIANYISSLGVKKVFGYQGGNIAHMIDSIWRHPNIDFISTYNEQGASFSACGYALENQTIGVALASSGPGAINLISGIANAYYDSIPTLFITGNVSTPTMKQSDEVRQNAFQENDIVSMVQKVTKYAVTIKEPHELRYHFEKAIYLAAEGRPGPVLLDIPHNVQKADLDFENEIGFTYSQKEYHIESHVYQDVIEAISNSSRPLIIAGGGINSDASRCLFHQLIQKWDIPVVCTLRGLDAISHQCVNYIGFGGAYGNRAANYAIKYADVILVLGARLDERFISLNDKSLFNKKKVFHVDIDPIELGRVLPSEYKIQSDVSVFLEGLMESELPKSSFQHWLNTVRTWNERYPSIDEDSTINKYVKSLTSNASENATFTIDIGINQMCVAQSIFLNGNQRCYTSAGHGAMGCSIPLAIGAAYAAKGKAVNCFVGDGALQMNIQELLMLGKNQLPIHVILMNNMCLGMIRDYQTKAFDSRFAATVDILHGINYKKIAEAYGLKYFQVGNKEGLSLAADMLRSEEPCFIELLFTEEADTNPKLGFDMFSQLPLLSEEEIKKMDEEASMCGNSISW